jgi:hypothetical protein
MAKIKLQKIVLMSLSYDALTGDVLTELPKTFGAIPDFLYDLRAERLRLNRLVTALEEQELKFKLAVLDRFPKQQLTGARGARGKLEIEPIDVPTLADPQKFFKHVKKTGEFDLLERRLSREAVKLRWQAGKEIPGVDHFKDRRLAIKKA